MTDSREIKPTRIADAYEDRPAVWRRVRNAGPYPLMMSLGGYEGFHGTTSPWFRAHWALDGAELIDDVALLLANEKFIEASRSVFSASIVRPVALTVNLMGPMKSGDNAHVDTPMYRGLNRKTFPTWLLVVMGASGLFERWYVRTAGALTWFYDGPNGAYEYWPDGPEGDVTSEQAPFGNVAIVGDNDHMYHRVADIGRPEDYLPDGILPTSALLLAGPNDTWVVVDGNGTLRHSYRAGKVRVSLLWKAIAFEDESEVVVVDNHLDDLSVDQVVDIFRADLRVKGSALRAPVDPFLDQTWQRALVTNYALGSPRR